MSIDSHGYDLFPTNMLLSAGSGFVAMISNLDPVITIVLPVAFFIVGKAVDVAVRIYLAKKDE